MSSDFNSIQRQIRSEDTANQKMLNHQSDRNSNPAMAAKEDAKHLKWMQDQGFMPRKFK